MNPDIFRLEHIRDCADRIIELTQLLQTLENFELRWIEQDAMIRNFEVIGEASRYISEEIKEKYPYIEWKAIRGMRNFMTHQYFGIQLDTVWNTAIHDIPVLREKVDRILAEI